MDSLCPLMGILAVTAEVEGGDIQPLNLVQGHVIVALPCQGSCPPES